ncbi:MAG: serine/threonine-protein kinase [Planctomycetota bacterium]
MTDDRERLIAALVAGALEEQDRTGRMPDAHEICHDHPDLEDDVAAALRAADRLPDLEHAALGAEPAVGRTVGGRYRIEGRLGAGAMGVVWAAMDKELGRPVALKVLAGALIERPDAAQRFDREAAALASLQHPSIVSVFDRGTLDDGSPYVAMERIEGVALSEILDAAEEHGDETEWIRGQFGIDELSERTFVRQAARWMADVAGGLAAAHERRIVHRDVKPSNVMVRRDGSAVLLDFGIAAVEGHLTLTRSEAALGTPAYMAPEMLRGRSRPEPAQDVYGVAATLYHLVTGRAPYTGTPSEILSKLATREPVPASRLRPRIPRDLQAILDVGLQREPNRRYASARELREDLEALLDLRPVKARPTSALTRSLRRARRSPLTKGLLAAAVAVAAFAGISEIRSQRRAAVEADWVAAWQAIPANLGLMAERARTPDRPEDVADVAATLDRVVELGIDPIPSRAIRASFRLDRGDRDGAVEDVRAIARRLGTDYGRALVRAYEALPPDANSALQLGLAKMPEPKLPLEHYLAGYHRARQMQRDDLRRFMTVEGLEDVRHARELAILARTPEVTDRSSSTERLERFSAAASFLSDALQLEEDFGWRSAMSAHLVAFGSIGMRNWAAGLEACQASSALSPHSVGVRFNAIVAARNLGRYDVVREEAAEGLRIERGYGPIEEFWLTSEIDDHSFERALEMVDEFESFSDEQRSYLIALIYASEAFVLFFEGEREEAVAIAADAVAILDELDPEQANPEIQEVRSQAAAVGESDPVAFFLSLLDPPGGYTLTVPELDLMLAMMPDEIPPEATPGLRRLLETVRDALESGAFVRTGSGVESNG